MLTTRLSSASTASLLSPDLEVRLQWIVRHGFSDAAIFDALAIVRGSISRQSYASSHSSGPRPDSFASSVSVPDGRTSLISNYTTDSQTSRVPSRLRTVFSPPELSSPGVTPISDSPQQSACSSNPNGTVGIALDLSKRLPALPGCNQETPCSHAMNSPYGSTTAKEAISHLYRAHPQILRATPSEATPGLDSSAATGYLSSRHSVFCPRCKKGFKDGGSLKKHLLEQCEQEQEWRCLNCVKTFKCVWRFREHHNKIHSCELCPLWSEHKGGRSRIKPRETDHADVAVMEKAKKKVRASGFMVGPDAVFTSFGTYFDHIRRYCEAAQGRGQCLEEIKAAWQHSHVVINLLSSTMFENAWLSLRQWEDGHRPEYWPTLSWEEADTELLVRDLQYGVEAHQIKATVAEAYRLAKKTHQARRETPDCDQPMTDAENAPQPVGHESKTNATAYQTSRPVGYTFLANETGRFLDHQPYMTHDLGMDTSGQPWEFVNVHDNEGPGHVSRSPRSTSETPYQGMEVSAAVSCPSTSSSCWNKSSHHPSIRGKAAEVLGEARLPRKTAWGF